MKKIIIILLNIIFSRVKPFYKNYGIFYQKDPSDTHFGYENVLGYTNGKRDRYITWISEK